MQRTHQTVLIAGYYIIGLISFFNEATVLIGLALFLATTAMLIKNKISNILALGLAISFLTAIGNASLQYKTSDELSKFAPSNVTLTGRIVSIPTTNFEDKTKFYLNAKSIKCYDEELKDIENTTLVTLYDTKNKIQSLKIGDTLKLEGKLLKPHSATNPRQFDYSKYLKNFDTHTLFISEKWSLESKADTTYWKSIQALNQKRQEIINIHSKCVKSPNIELLGGIVFGDDAVNPPDFIKKSFINSGLLHILAASGMNVTLIFGIWFFISQRFKIHYKLSIITGMVLIIFYTCMTGFGPSIMRATLMLIFILLGKLINRDADTIALLFFIAGVLLVYDPAMINNIGFQLSFIVTFGLLFTCPILFKKVENKALNATYSLVMVPFIAQLYAAPIQIFYFGTFATYSVLANIAIIPCLTIVSFVGFISSMFALIPSLGLFICKISDFTINPFLSAIISLSNFFSQLKYSLLHLPHPSPFQIVLYYLILIAITIQIKKRFDKRKFLILLSSLLLLFGLTFINLNGNSCEIIFFDVKNADSALIKTPENKYILIDTGKAPYKNKSSQAEQIILKYLKDKGVKELNTLILTHYDSDHSGGAIDILKSIKVKAIYVSPREDENETLLSKEIARTIKETKVQKEKKTNCIILKEKDLLIEDITPSNNQNNENENSRITLLNYKGQKILFTGDATSSTLKHIKNEKINNIDVLKAGHHGAENSLNEGILSTTSPRTVVISTGENSYGHPSKKLIKLLKEKQIKTYRTDYNNAIKIVISQNKTSIYTFNQSKKGFVKDLEH